MARTRSFDEDAVLDRAIELFQDRGYEATSISDLESHLGIGRQSLYNAFGDKRAFFLKALNRYIDANRDMLERVLRAPDASLPEVVAYFEQSLAMAAAHEKRSCFVVNSILEVGESDASVAQSCGRSEEGVRGALEAALTNAATKGELRDGVDVHAAVGMLLSQIYGNTVRAKAGTSLMDLRRSFLLAIDGIKATH